MGKNETTGRIIDTKRTSRKHSSMHNILKYYIIFLAHNLLIILHRYGLWNCYEPYCLIAPLIGIAQKIYYNQ